MLSKKRLSTLAVLAALVMCLSLLFCGCGDEESKYPTPTKDEYVNDFAGVITESDKKDMMNRGKDLEDKTTAEIAVITVKNTDGEAIEDYALNIGREWGVGKEDENNGLVVVLSTEDREVYVAVGYGLEGALPDSKVGRIIDSYAVPSFKEDKFSEGLAKLFKALVNEVFIENGIEVEEGYIPANQLPEPESETSPFSAIIYWIILIVVVIVYAFVFRGRGIFIIGGPFGGFRGGGFGGGSGGSFGGGFGGGSFGGGGAGRKF